MANKSYTCGQNAVARRLGDGKEYKIRICGIAYDESPCIFYIVEMIDLIPGFDGWTHKILIDSCIDEK